MGNWMTVHIAGTCDANDIEALREKLDCMNFMADDFDMDKLGCLSYGGGVAGLPMWAMERISVTGNLFERGYTVDSVAAHLEEIAGVASSLEVDIHCGGDYESEEVVKTVRLRKGKVKIIKPQMKKLPEISQAQMMGNMMAQLNNQRRGK